MTTLSIVIPIFNEGRTVRALSEALIALPGGLVYEYVIVDDGSSDHSANVLQGALLGAGLKSTLVTKKNGGKGTAIVAGIPLCTGSHMMIFDADLELDPQDLKKMIQPILDGKSEVVFGIRNFSSQSSFTYRYVIGNKALSHLFGVLFNKYTSDIMCGAKLLPMPLWQKMDLKLHGFTTEAEIAAKVWSAGYTPWEVEVSYSPRTREEGKGITVFDAVKIIFLLFSLRLRLRKTK